MTEREKWKMWRNEENCTGQVWLASNIFRWSTIKQFICMTIVGQAPYTVRKFSEQWKYSLHLENSIDVMYFLNGYVRVGHVFFKSKAANQMKFCEKSIGLMFYFAKQRQMASAQKRALSLWKRSTEIYSHWCTIQRTLIGPNQFAPFATVHIRHAKHNQKSNAFTNAWDKFAITLFALTGF